MQVLLLNMGLRRLDMSSCRIGPDACLLIANGLKVRLVCLFATCAVLRVLKQQLQQ